MEYTYPLATYHTNETIIPNKLILAPVYIKSIYSIPSLPAGLYINQTNGNIYGKPLFTTMSKEDYTIHIITLDKNYTTYISIIIETFTTPDNFYIHDSLTGINYINNNITNPPVFKTLLPLRIEIAQQTGYVDQYYMIDNISYTGLIADTSKSGHLIISGIANMNLTKIEYNL